MTGGVKQDSSMGLWCVVCGVPGLRVGRGRKATTVLPIWFHHDHHSSRPSPQMTRATAANWMILF